jgi:hypothetical protein
MSAPGCALDGNVTAVRDRMTWGVATRHASRPRQS